MTGEELRLAVAVKLGFKLKPDGKTGEWPPTRGIINVKFIPGYDWDLNAMHEAERVYVIPKKLGQIYTEFLDEETGEEHGVYHATATERARAFIRLP